MLYILLFEDLLYIYIIEIRQSLSLEEKNYVHASFTEFTEYDIFNLNI